MLAGLAGLQGAEVRGGSEVKILLVLPEMPFLKAVPAISEELPELFWLISRQ